ncbi:hypothetical protein AB0L70_31490 [Kribbella sp. NPDC051952]|uniref:hypothetical protein n=1 Tax=Kribbella sp. NPDC051952 TaxID=3154851 RepID=UPI00343EB7FB
MTKPRAAAGLLGTAVLAGALVPATASAAAGQASAACSLSLGSVTTAGDHKRQKVTATSPASVTQPVLVSTGLFPVDTVRLASGLGFEPDPPSGWRYSGYATIGNDLFAYQYVLDQTTGQLDPASSVKRRVGGGWTPEYTYLEESRYSTRTSTYALHGGVINRWTVNAGVWRNKATYSGFSAVKTMTLISQTATYDTFLATTRGGALYTIHIPLSGAPVVKKVRASTWQGFETLIAEKCGNQSTLLLGIDKDTRTAYLYAVSHANGTATVIKGLGTVGTEFAAFADKTYYRYYGADPEAPKLSGE